MTQAAQIKKLDSIRQFLLGGNATFTVKSKLTGEHRTYHVEKGDVTAAHPIPTWFVKQLEGPEFFKYVGFCRCDGTTGEIVFIHAKGTNPATPGIAGFKWLLGILNNLVEPAVQANFDRCAEFMHEGKCGVCGRPLTNPESIEIGIGPVCLERMGA